MKTQKQIDALKRQIEKVEKIVKALEKEQETFESGNFYKNRSSGNIFYYQGCGTGVKVVGWRRMIMTIYYRYKPATPQEVESALIEEAKRRGFKENEQVRFDSPFIPDYFSDRVSFSGAFVFREGKLLLKMNTTIHNPRSIAYTIFKDGKWAEIVGDDQIEINGHKMEIDGDLVKFGCAVFSKFFFVNLFGVVNQCNGGANENGIKHRGIVQDCNRKIKSVTLDSDVEISIELLGKIVEAIDNK